MMTDGQRGAHGRFGKFDKGDGDDDNDDDDDDDDEIGPWDNDDNDNDDEEIDWKEGDWALGRISSDNLKKDRIVQLAHAQLVFGVQHLTLNK